MKAIKNSLSSKKSDSSACVVSDDIGLVGNTEWHLPSGKRLEEFALEGGYLAPLLLKTASFCEWRPVKQEGKRS